MTTYSRATAGYDEAHERALVDAIVRAVAKTSMVSDANVMALRTGESAAALLHVLSIVLALSPSATRSPTAIRKTVEALGRRLKKLVAQAEFDEDVRQFISRCFHGCDVGGHA